MEEQKRIERLETNLKTGTIIAVIVFIVVILIGIVVLHIMIDNVISEAELTTMNQQRLLYQLK